MYTHLLGFFIGRGDELNGFSERVKAHQMAWMSPLNSSFLHLFFSSLNSGQGVLCSPHVGYVPAARCNEFDLAKTSHEMVIFRVRLAAISHALWVEYTTQSLLSFFNWYFEARVRHCRAAHNISRLCAVFKNKVHEKRHKAIMFIIVEFAAHVQNKAPRLASCLKGEVMV